MAKKLSQHAAAAKIIRKEIKAMGLKASVRAKSASMTSSVDVTLYNPTPEQYKQVKALVSKFQYGYFNGYEDIYVIDNKIVDLPQVKFTFVSTEFDEELKQKALDALCEVLRIDPINYEDRPDIIDVGAPYTTYTDSIIRQILSGTFDRIDFWSDCNQEAV